ncbi:MAG: hypothetical protein RSE94_24630, partial [Pseudomonas sp.]
ATLENTYEQSIAASAEVNPTFTGGYGLLHAWGARGRVFESLRPDQKTPRNPSTYGCLDFFMSAFFMADLK